LENFREFIHAINTDSLKTMRKTLPFHVLDLIVQRFPQQFEHIAKCTG
jgi:hypothetical protein